ncbi:MAG: ABC transporter permease [Actinomycetota bacterium]|nr:ABC transporter permease [Actinomycetota bacterium]
MNRLVEIARVVRWAAESGARDYASIYTWKSWLAAWYLRVLAQVVFFALIGRLLESDDAVYFLLIGNAVMLAAMEGIWALNLISWERHTSTLPLLVASPSSPVTVFGARGLYMAADGLISAMGALFVAGPIFGLPLPWPDVLLVPPLTALVGLSAYCFGTFLGGVIIGYREINNVVVNGSILLLMAIAGVNVPVDYYPEPVEWISNILPLTHGLDAIREVLAEGEAFSVLVYAAMEGAVALGWLTLALFTFNRLATRGRADGSIEFGA